jgi:hypothetical protein
MKNAALILLVAACAGLGACGGDETPGVMPGDTLVYESRQAITCGTRGLTTQQSAQKLINGGVDVVQSNCGVITGIALPAVCGIDSAEIIIHEIRRANLRDAEQRGFHPVRELVNPVQGFGYDKVDCETRVPLP